MKLKKFSFSGISFAITFTTVMIIFAYCRFSPFGDNSILSNDLGGQYVYYYAYFRKVLSGEADSVYTFSKALGGDFLSLFAYYLASPVNLFVTFFPDRLLPVAFCLLIAIKMVRKSLWKVRICILR